MNEAPLVNLKFNKDTSDQVVQIGDNYYKFEVSLVNADGRAAQIRYSAISEFLITEDLKQFYTEGYIVFDNTLDVLENIDSIGLDIAGKPIKVFEPYVIRGDGRDLLIVNITPQINEQDVFKAADKKIAQGTLNYVFAVYDFEDIITTDKTTKLKKLFLRDFSYQLLTERNSYYSTGALKKGTSNTDRSIYTGEAIRTLLQTTLVADFNIPQIFSPGWDFGSSKIFYSSSSRFKAIDDLYFLLDNHVSTVENDYSPCILSKSRNNMWSLTPVTKYFKSVYYRGNDSFGDVGAAGIIENFIIARPNAGDAPTITLPQRNPSVSLFANNFADYSFIDDFQFSNMAVDDAQNSIVTTAVHSYDFTQGAFTIDLQQNNLEQSSSLFNKNFVAGLKGNNRSQPYSNLTLNQLRLQNKNIINRFNPNPDSNVRINSGRNRTLLASLFLNNAISFRARGNTFRQPGKFITVDRTDNQTPTEFDNKIAGIYFILKVDHVFKNGQYNNFVIASKTYTADKVNVSNKVI